MILRVKDNEGNIIPIPAIQGESAYDVAVNNGFEGTEEEWLDSLKGGVSDEILEDINSNTEARHSHDNKETLDKLSESEDGTLLFDGKVIEGGGGSAERPTAAVHCTTDTAYFMVETNAPNANYVTAVYYMEGDENPEVVEIINNNMEVKDISIVVSGETIPLSRVAEKDGEPFILTSDRPYFCHDSSLYYIVLFSAYYPNNLGYLGTHAASIDDIIITYYTD